MSCISRKQLLFTGFGPFGPHDYNPALDLARRAAANCRKTPSDSEKLSVTYPAVKNFAGRLAEFSKPHIVIEFGLAAERNEVCLERTARNYRGPRPDEIGSDTPLDCRLVRRGPSQLSTRLQVDPLRKRLHRHLTDSSLELDCRLSDDAGHYVCNALYYHSLREARRTANGSVRALFIHIPPLRRAQIEPLARSLGFAIRQTLLAEEE